MAPDVAVLRRYTDLPSVISLLRSKKLTLLDPASWEDKADARFMARYKEQGQLSCLAALCFSMASETFHHWRIFSHGAGGVCVSFRTAALLDSLRDASGVLHNKVQYLKLTEIGQTVATLEQLPFAKRHAYRDEKEYRIIYRSKKRLQQPISLEFPLASIDRVTISPWLDAGRFAALKSTLLSIPGCSRLAVRRSTLMDNEKWGKFGDGAA